MCIASLLRTDASAHALWLTAHLWRSFPAELPFARTKITSKTQIPSKFLKISNSLLEAIAIGMADKATPHPSPVEPPADGVKPPPVYDAGQQYPPQVMAEEYHPAPSHMYGQTTASHVTVCYLIL